jgi:nitric oxide reductase NorD protein
MPRGSALQLIQDLARFRLLASAIAGRHLEVVSADPGDTTWTDGVTVFVESGVPARRQLLLIVVQASLLGAGSLQAEVLSAISSRAALARRYLAVEGHRALAAQGMLLPPPVTAIVDPATAARSDSPAASLAVARSNDPIPESPDLFGTIRPRQVRMTAQQAAGHPGVAGRHVARAGGKDVLGDLDDEDPADARPRLDLLSSPVGGSGVLGRLLKKMLGGARSQRDGEPGADAPTHWSARPSRARRTVSVTASRASSGEVGVPGERSSTTLPEWDVYRSEYRPGWCTVVEDTPETAELASCEVPNTRGLRRALGRLGMEFERCHRQLQGDEIDVDAAVELCVEMKAGSAADEAVYREAQRRRHDLSVLVLLDVSGSAGEPSTSGVPVHEHQRAAAAALLSTLHELGNRVALYAFRSRGRRSVQVMPLKRFSDGFEAVALRRLGGLIPGAYTRLGAAIRHGAGVLERECGTARRLLVVISDGFAYDHGYEGVYGEADARRALAEARKRGTGCLCISVGANTEVAALRRVFGTAAHGSVARTQELPTVVGPLFRGALASAELQRRTSQRGARAWRAPSDRRSA